MINIVLYEPEIPQNTGNIMRTCVATNSKLHLIKPLGFSLDEKHLRRSGLDYIKDLDFNVYENYEDFKKVNYGTYIYITRYGKKPPSSFNFKEIQNDIYLIFGKESTGIPKTILKENLDYCFRLPMANDIRSLNLSNCVAIVTYEVLRQLDYPSLSLHETIKGENFIDL